MKQLKNWIISISITICIILIMLIIASIIDTNMHNDPNSNDYQQFKSWNLIQMLN